MFRDGRALLERAEETGAIDAALGAARTVGQVVWIEGPSGIGKSRLVGYARQAGADAGFDVLVARGGIFERDIPFGVARQFSDGRLAAAGPEERSRIVAGPAARLDALLAGDAGSTVPAEAAAELMSSFFWLIVNLAAIRPVLLVLDDAHWSDGLSLRLAAFLARRLDGLPVCLVGAARTDEPGADEALLAELATTPGAVVLRPAPLSLDAVLALVAEQVPDQEADALAAACHHATGGNPFLVRELVGAIAQDDARTSPEEVTTLAPVGIARAILLRLGRLGPEARRLAVAAAVLDDGADLRVAAAVARLSEPAAAEAADLLVRGTILADVLPLRFSHPIVRAAITEDMTPGARAAEHGRAARALDAAGAHADLVAAHLLRSEPRGDSWAVTHLLQAAARAIGRGDPPVATRLLDRAAAEPAGDATGDVLAALGHARFHSGREAESAEALERALEHVVEPARRLELHLLQAYARFSAHGVGDAADAMARALEDARAVGPHAARRLEAEMVGQAWMGVTTAPQARGMLESHRDAGHATAEDRLVLAYHAVDALALGTAAEARDLALRAWGDGRFLQDETTRAVAYYGLMLVLMACEADGVDELLQAGFAECRERGSTFGIAGIFGQRGLLEIERGNLTAAEADMASCAEFAVPTLAGLAASWQALVALERGDVDEAAAGWTGVEAPSGETHGAWFFGPYVRGRIAFAVGRYADAARDLAAVGERVATTGGFGAAMPWAPHLALALHADRRPDEAEAAGRAATDAARRFGAPGRLGLALRAAARTGGRVDRVDTLLEARSVLEGSRARLEHARTEHELGVALLREGHRREGRAHLTVALDLARACGARGLARAAHEELLTAGARPRPARDSGAETLTASERRVASMAADGLTNREIAQALVVTPKTVENQLGAVYRKLGIGSRRDIMGALQRRTERPAV